jgi:hypothetical protein
VCLCVPAACSCAHACVRVCVCLPGIIDILQQYDLKKRGETVLKSVIHARKDISSVEPKFYAKRFLNFLSEHTV